MLNCPKSICQPNLKLFFSVAKLLDAVTVAPTRTFVVPGSVAVIVGAVGDAVTVTVCSESDCADFEVRAFHLLDDFGNYLR